uniref:BAALC binder of MAP3K1 and KLF4 b n=1 Tax=Monopterus albus TaxID=43700 RepID=A0A3Q3QV58_MONAL
MGCGGSRADAIIEPRYHESWTRDTESTWLTNTDVETPLPVANGKIHHRVFLSFGRKSKDPLLCLTSTGKALEASLREKRMVNTGTQCGKQALPTTGSNQQRRPRRSLTDVSISGSRMQDPAACHLSPYLFVSFYKNAFVGLLCRIRINFI